MSYKTQLNHLKRDGDSAPGQRIVEVLSEAIAAGELAAGEKLPRRGSWPSWRGSTT